MNASPVLEARDLSAGYGSQPVVRELDIHVRAGEVVALLGPNGAGKTTTMLALSGELAPLSGGVWLDGAPARTPLHRRARNGLAFVTEERSVFMGLTGSENLRVGRCDVGLALTLFPELRGKLGTRGGLLSGGEQQILALARALSRKPRILLADELSLGLAPLVVERLLAAVRKAADEGCAVLLVEQHVRQALRIADRGYVMRRGTIVLTGTGTELRARISDIEASYLAASAEST